MGIYIYGITANKRDVEGIDEPLHSAKYISKLGYGWGNEQPRSVNAAITRYCNAPHRGDTYVHAFKEGEQVYKRKTAFSNTFYDSDPMTVIGTLTKRGGKWALKAEKHVDYA